MGGDAHSTAFGWPIEPGKQSRGLAQKRSIGAYYTPAYISAALAEWAIQDSSNVILEPSFGGCELLRAAQLRLAQLGSNTPSFQLYGCDVDPLAFSALNVKFSNVRENQFLKQNFLTLNPSDFRKELFDVVLGNPPYIRHHSMGADIKTSAGKVATSTLPEIDRKSNLWAYFVIHSTNFLRLGGRAAWVLPQSAIYASYAQPIMDFLCKRFREVRLIALNKRVFRHEGADEGTVILLLDDWGGASIGETAQITTVENHVQFLAALNSPDGDKPDVTQAASNLVQTLGVELGTICSVRIGVVTGDASFFLFNQERANHFGLDEKSLSPVFSKGGAARGLSVDEKDLADAFRHGWKTAIFDTRKLLTKNAKAYLSTFSDEKIASNVTFKKRPIWHQPMDDERPDAFLVSMSYTHPRLILADGSVNCTNSIYRLSFNKEVSKSAQKLASISMVSTFGQLSAELCGRVYGAGLLKHEPSDARRIRIPTFEGDDTDATFKKLDALLRSRKIEDAQLCADHFLIDNRFINLNELRLMSRALEQRRSIRLGLVKLDR